MSRKKAARGKAASSSPSSGSPAGRSSGRAARSSPGIVQMNGVVHPSRPSISSSSEFYDIAFKVMLVGDSGVGKTCLLVRFKDGAFLAGSFISTVGIDFRNKVLNIDGVKVKLQIWDTAGQERFRSVTHAYYRDANALLLLYDVTNKSSFDNIQTRGILRRHSLMSPSLLCSAVPASIHRSHSQSVPANGRRKCFCCELQIAAGALLPNEH
ncbi:ras-related protein Rab-26 isoform X2 [Austrofundulus limnaeus]|uniref:small monomeric GTPase n=1 Tax=Austrofundulus limnaeus TaxID=52670 RepID=A0A2I4BCP0_AUSLI|nr:PREDICTED: ras-related protein Rab-26 isoform X2 [Austrofundulus limnaeus]